MGELRTMERVKVVVLMDEGLLHYLERVPANSVLAMMEASGEQVKSALAYINEDKPVPEALAAMTFWVAGVEVLSAVEDYGHTDPRTSVHDPDHRYVVHRLSQQPVLGGPDTV